MYERLPGTVRARVCVCVCVCLCVCACVCVLYVRITMCLSVRERSGSCRGHAVGEEGMWGRVKEGGGGGGKRLD